MRLQIEMVISVGHPFPEANAAETPYPLLFLFQDQPEAWLLFLLDQCRRTFSFRRPESALVARGEKSGQAEQAAHRQQHSVRHETSL